MKLSIAILSEIRSHAVSALKNVMPSIGRLYSLQKYLSAIQVTKLFFVFLLCCSACRDKSPAQPDIKFDKTKWNLKNDRNYTYRKQMVNDLLNNYRWAGLKKDSVIQMLGQPDDIEEGNLMYDYKEKSFLGGVGTIIEAVVFELAPDSTVKAARLNDGGWD